MNFDAGDFFVVSRGERMTQATVHQGFGGSTLIPIENELFSERYKDALFKILATDGEFISAEVVWDPCQKSRGFSLRKILINVNDVEIRTVPKNVAMSLSAEITTVQNIQVLPPGFPQDPLMNSLGQPFSGFIPRSSDMNDAEETEDEDDGYGN